MRGDIPASSVIAHLMRDPVTDILCLMVTENLINKLKELGWRIVTAESCTGGLIAAEITSISGSADVFERGFVTYSNLAKSEMLDVRPNTLAKHGAVSAEVCREMAEGALKKSHSDIAISVTGIAGPTGGNAEKPVGLVYIGVATNNGTRITKNNFSGNRDAIRRQTVKKAIELALEEINRP